MDERKIMIEIEDITVRFNMASERIDNLKEYIIKLLKRELMFQEFLALKHVSLTIRKGEAWGLIGTNGSGKSTLLKLICMQRKSRCAYGNQKASNFNRNPKL